MKLAALGPETLPRRTGLWIEFTVVMLLAWAPTVASHIVNYGGSGVIPGQHYWLAENLAIFARLLAILGCAAYLLSITGDLRRLDFRLRLRTEGWIALGLVAVGAFSAFKLFPSEPSYLYFVPISPFGIGTGVSGILCEAVFSAGIFTGYTLIRLPELLGYQAPAIAIAAIVGGSYFSIHPAIFAPSAAVFALLGIYFLKFGRLGLVTLAFCVPLSVGFAIELWEHFHL